MQFSIPWLGVGSGVPDANGQFKGDPVLHDADAELRTLLDQVYVIDYGLKSPLLEYVYRSEDDCDEREEVKRENGNILVLFLFAQNCYNVAQREQD